MDLSEPQPLTAIIDKLDARTVIGSAMRTAEWETMPQALRDRAVFSAGVESVRWLGVLDQGIKDIVTRAKSVNEKGESYFTADRSKIIADLRNLGKQIGIPHPDGPRKDGKIHEGDLTDPLSIRRLKLIVNTQMDMAYGYANYLAANDPTVLEQWPCQEFIRIAPRKVPRAWRARWSAAGGQFYNGRMIARKDSPIWVAISRFGNPYPPFDYGSGMGVEDVDYDEAVSLGVITEGEQVQSEVKQFNEGLESSVKNLTPKEQGWLKHLLKDKVSIEDGVAKWVEPQPPNEAASPEKAGGGRKTVSQPKAGGGIQIEPHKPTKEEASIINGPVEVGFVYDEKGEAQKIGSGTANKITFTAEELKLLENRTFTHNHPSGVGFSQADFLLALKRRLNEVRAITAGGDGARWLHRLQVLKQVEWSEAQLSNIYSDAVSAADAHLDALQESGQASSRFIRRNRQHIIFLNLQEQLRDIILYQRISV